ncbi:molybdopterin-guanine dinucleotide biosynthesis protein A [Kibdelosporangium banguiense]|uniref:Molybdopterin-guanine dinucleotide biosynthesis protein A n=1 Tax=Kibdelosporangium banguiense TaxID=1365924 RepID=A0ABS4TME8_9PSEU|nr:NTP transferase domain-containing protein [Kibdelosporangium banguiense]MBP2325592.1 molybdopterin-guanine dinucleotide biosynthesis protein A [Kibdelosporangium banguiense]
MGLAAVIFAGGKATRLGGVDKVMIEVAGRTLLSRSVDAVRGAERIVVVGPAREIGAAVRWVREEPPGSGPLAALAAGVEALADLPDDTHVAVLAGDLLGIGPRTVAKLRSALDENPAVLGALLVDAEGFTQWMHAVWRLAALRAAVPPDSVGRSLKSVLGGLPLTLIPAQRGEADDVDAPGDLPA